MEAWLNRDRQEALFHCKRHFVIIPGAARHLVKWLRPQLNAKRLVLLGLTVYRPPEPQMQHERCEDPEEEENVEKELKDLVEQLGNAIDESIAESGRIGEIVLEMERAGYDLSLVLEATMRFTPKDHAGDENPREEEFHSSRPALTPVGRFDLTAEDEEFLQSLKVAV